MIGWKIDRSNPNSSPVLGHKEAGVMVWKDMCVYERANVGQKKRGCKLSLFDLGYAMERMDISPSNLFQGHPWNPR